MKFIDEKGRLFGKINVIDFLAILLLICLTPTFYFGYKLLKGPEPPPEPPKKFMELEIDFGFIKVEPEILKLIAEGDKEIDEKGTVIGEIIRIGESKPYQHKFNIGTMAESFIIAKEDPELKEIPVRLKVKAEIRDDNLYYKDKYIVPNSPIDFKTSQYTITAIPFKEEEEEEEEELKEKWVEIKVKFSAVIPELAKVIAEGDTQKDSSGNIVGRLKTIITNKSSDVPVLGENKFITVSDPFHKDIVAILDLLCIEKDGVLYFKNQPVKMGNKITSTTDFYSVTGTIIGLEVK